MPRIADNSSQEILLRVGRLRTLLDLLRPVPPEWIVASRQVRGERGLTPIPCDSWPEVCRAWAAALRWRQELEDVLAVMLAVAMSTMQVGDQLFLLVIANAGSAKTRFCDSLLVSRTAKLLEHTTGFHSGYTDASGEDFSLITRIQGKTLVTPEGDVMMSSPVFAQVMSQMRRIFDGSSSASYKTRKEEAHHDGLRSPWIMAGTPALMAADQSRLGDRFLRVCIDDPAEDEKRAIMRRACASALREVLCTSDGQAETTLDPLLCHAYRVTGGYLDHLRGGAEELLARVDAGTPAQDAEAAVERCMDLAEFTADLRARPAPARYGLEPDVPDGKELPSRLVKQYARLGQCLGAVMQRGRVDAEVLRVVAKVARDTARGRTMDLCRRLRTHGEQGVALAELAVRLGLVKREAELARLLRFLANVGVAEWHRPEVPDGCARPAPHWRLTHRFGALWGGVMED